MVHFYIYLGLGFALLLLIILIWRRRNNDFHYLAADEVLNSMGDGVISLDAQKRLVSYNRAAAAIFLELSEHRIGEHIHHLKNFQEDMLDESSPKNFELDGHYYESHTKRIQDGNGKNHGYVILVIDVTDTKNYIDEIKRVRKQAEQASQAKSEFLANMSHEIRTPMNAIIGLSDIIIEESRGTEIAYHAENVQSAARNLLALINDILDLSKVEAGKMELVPINYSIKALADEVVSMMDMAASQKGLLMKYEYDESIPCRYYGDDIRIKQILINLLNNAVKFTTEGYVKISIGGYPGDLEEQEFLVFQVEDSGCGIKEEDRENIFENFQQVDAKRNRSIEGTGLGLSIVKHLLQLMQGKIEVESVYGKGTKFTVTIPQKIVDKRTLEEMPDIPQREAEKVENFISSKVRVLIVDDNVINRKVAKGFLKPYGFALTEANSGFEAIELVKSTKFDIIFMDHMMPVMDGIETVQNIRNECGENGTSPVIIALTANTMEETQKKFLDNGFQDFIAKPLSRKPLNDLLLKWVPEGQRDIQEETAEQTENNEMQSIVIKGIDIEPVMRYHTGSVEQYQELLELYCLEGERKTGLLQDLANQKDYENYRVEVHGLKSASANIGAMHVSALAREQEEAAIREDVAFIEEHFPALLTAYEKQLGDIRAYLKEQQPESVDADMLPAPDRETLQEEIQEALNQLERFRSRDCAKQIDTLLRYRLDQDITEKLQEIRSSLKLYEDDAAEMLLHQLLEWLDKEE